MKILNIDDDYDFNYVLSDVLSRNKHEVICTTNPTEFFTELERDVPDIFLVDYNILGIGDGESVVKTIQLYVGKKIPILIVSNADCPVLIKSMISSGADGFLKKPISEIDLIQKINYLKNPYKKQREASISPDESACELSVPTEMIEINQEGAFLKVRHFIEPRTIVKLESSLFRNMGFLGGILFQVADCTLIEENCYKVELHFKNNKHEILDKFKLYIATSILKNDLSA